MIQSLEDNYLKDPYHQQADIDEREERVYRRPPTYLIIASKIVRPASIYQVGTFAFNREGHNNDLFLDNCWFVARS